MPEYAQPLSTPQRFIAPAINPFSTANKDLSDEEIDDRMTHYNIPTDLPLIVQVSRFDKWKDPQGVIDAFRIARKEVDCTLVLVGNVATDDPEGQEVFASLCKCEEERIRILSVQDSALVNALQRRAAAVLQKSIREGFGLTVTEAMWKGACVIGGNAAGIRHQIRDGKNGFIVDSVEHAAARIVQLIKDPNPRQTLGKKAYETVRERFLVTRLMEQWLDLIGAFEAQIPARFTQIARASKRSITMSMLRRDPVAGNWVIIAPERSHRPGYGSSWGKPAAKTVSFDPTCPFCPGNESQLPPIITEIASTDRPGWSTRVVGNKFPIVSQRVERCEGGPFYETAEARGFHEVVIESPRHDSDLTTMSTTEVRDVLLTYRDRHDALMAVEGHPVGLDLPQSRKGGGRIPPAPPLANSSAGNGSAARAAAAGGHGRLLSARKTLRPL